MCINDLANHNPIDSHLTSLPDVRLGSKQSDALVNGVSMVVFGHLVCIFLIGVIIHLIYEELR